MHDAYVCEPVSEEVERNIVKWARRRENDGVFLVPNYAHGI
jgi:hypothetical protein